MRAKHWRVRPMKQIVHSKHAFLCDCLIIYEYFVTLFLLPKFPGSICIRICTQKRDGTLWGRVLEGILIKNLEPAFLFCPKKCPPNRWKVLPFHCNLTKNVRFTNGYWSSYIICWIWILNLQSKKFTHWGNVCTNWVTLRFSQKWIKRKYF